MSHRPLIYPATPTNVPDAVTRPSAAFKKEVSKVMGSIVLFFIVYLILIILAIGLAAASVYGGIMLIIAMPKFLTLLLGGGLIGLGVMVFFFLVKFIFAVSRYDSSGSIEITEEDHPKLFAFIRQLTIDTQTPFPKRIFLTPEVNASVSYDSSFWSMFLPVKKNLQIGLGLVNSVNLSEFKAVMAHEFGHFSQRSMKLGSFVYNVNRVIYNMLFENTGYGRTLQAWASIHGAFAIFATITAKIVMGIQYILRQMYGLINKNYLSLSREMEFHADAVSASVSGSANCISALRRIEFAGNAYGLLIEKYSALYKQKYVSTNLYPDQHFLFRKFAEDFKLTLKDNLPEVNEAFLKTLAAPRINFKDQWASHPSMNERSKHLADLAVVAETSTESPWVLFENPEEWQKKLTNKVYHDIELTPEIKLLDADGFAKKLTEQEQLRLLPEAYNGFYDNRAPSKMNIAALCNEVSEKGETEKFENIFSKENGGIQSKITTLDSDIEILNAIANQQIEVKTFDFEGEKYPAAEAAPIMGKLKKERQFLQQQLETLDAQAFKYFYNKALQQNSFVAEDLKRGWNKYYETQTEMEKILKKCNEIMHTLQPLFQGNLHSVEQALQMANTLENEEDDLKELLKQWISVGAFDHAPDFKEELESFISKDYQYFSGESFFDNELKSIHNIITEGWDQLTEFQYRQWKQLLEKQIALN